MNTAFKMRSTMYWAHIHKITRVNGVCITLYHWFLPLLPKLSLATSNFLISNFFMNMGPDTVWKVWYQKKIMLFQMVTISCWNLCIHVWAFNVMLSCLSHNGTINHSSANLHAPSHAAYFLWSCDKVYHKQEVCFFVFSGSDCQLKI